MGERSGRRGSGPGRAGALLFLLAAVSAPRATAAEATMPGAMQASMAVRILEYDRALGSWAGKGIAVGVVARNGKGPGLAEFRQALEGRVAQGIPITVAEYAYRDAEGLRQWIERTGVKLVYLAADMGPESAPGLSGPGRRLPTLVATRGQFQEGATLGLVAEDGKPRVLVNLSASKAAGMSLDPKLLQLSEVVR